MIRTPPEPRILPAPPRLPWGRTRPAPGRPRVVPFRHRPGCPLYMAGSTTAGYVVLDSTGRRVVDASGKICLQCNCCVNGNNCSGCPTPSKTPKGATLVVSGVTNSTACFSLFEKWVGTVNGGPWKLTQTAGDACSWQSAQFPAISGYQQYNASPCSGPFFAPTYESWFLSLKTDLTSSAPWAGLGLQMWDASGTGAVIAFTGSVHFTRQLNGTCTSTFTLANPFTNGTPGASGGGPYWGGSATITWDCVT